MLSIPCSHAEAIMYIVYFSIYLKQISSHWNPDLEKAHHFTQVDYFGQNYAQICTPSCASFARAILHYM